MKPTCNDDTTRAHETIWTF